MNVAIKNVETKNSESTKRQSNIELLRIICMLLIVMGHIVNQSEILTSKNLYYTGNDIFALIVGSGSRMAVNCFLIISCWFLVDKEFKIKRVIQVWLETFMYTFIITVICKAFNFSNVSIGTLIKSCLPITAGQLWYVQIYMGLLFLTPFLNKIMKGLSKQVHFKLLVVLFVMITLIPTILFMNPFYSKIGWFVFVYLLIGYIKKYNIKIFKNPKCLVPLGGVTYLILCTIKGVCIFISRYSPSIAKYSDKINQFYLHEIQTIPLLLSALIVFFAFKNIKMKYNKFIDYIASSTLAVYIIHQVPSFYPFLWEKVFHIKEAYSSSYFPLYFLGVVLIIFVVCIFIDKIRIKIMDKLIFRTERFNKVCQKIDNWFTI